MRSPGPPCHCRRSDLSGMSTRGTAACRVCVIVVAHILPICESVPTPQARPIEGICRTLQSRPTATTLASNDWVTSTERPRVIPTDQWKNGAVPVESCAKGTT
jgi:hypothetical protein